MAKKIAINYIGSGCSLMEGCTIEKPYGWYFCFQSKSYLKSGKFEDQLVGSGGFIVNRKNGQIYEFGSTKTLEENIKEYEANLLDDELFITSPNNNKEGFNWFGAIICILPFIFVVAHFVWPKIFFLKMVANAIILLAGAILFSALSENIHGVKQFSLPVFNIFLVLISGMIACLKFGWYSTLIILAIYGTFCVISGIIVRTKL